MNRLETELSGKLQVIRLNIQDPVGYKLSERFDCRIVPSFIFFDVNGIEAWRSVGSLDAEKVRTSVDQMRVSD